MLPGTCLLRENWVAKSWFCSGRGASAAGVRGVGRADTESDCWALRPGSEPAPALLEGVTALIVCKGCLASLWGAVNGCYSQIRGAGGSGGGMEQSRGGGMGEAADRWPGGAQRHCVD